ncbi:MAG: hypothetical protein Kow00108_02260 [Calditrichia bacterium]
MKKSGKIPFLTISFLIALLFTNWIFAQNAYTLTPNDIIRYQTHQQPGVFHYGVIEQISGDTIFFGGYRSDERITLKEIRKIDVLIDAKEMSMVRLVSGGILGGIVGASIGIIEDKQIDSDFFGLEKFITGFYSLLGMGAGAAAGRMIGEHSASLKWQNLNPEQITFSTNLPKKESQVFSIGMNYITREQRFGHRRHRGWRIVFAPGIMTTPQFPNVQESMQSLEENMPLNSTSYDNPKDYPKEFNEYIDKKLFAHIGLYYRIRKQHEISFQFSNAHLGRIEGLYYSMLSTHFYTIEPSSNNFSMLYHHRILNPFWIGIGPSLFINSIKLKESDRQSYSFSQSRYTQGLTFQIHFIYPETTKFFLQGILQYRVSAKSDFNEIRFADVRLNGFSENFSHFFAGIGIGMCLD